MSEKSIGERIREIREEKGYSLEDLSRITGMSPSVLSQIENHMSSPSLGVLIKLSKALEVPLGRFLGEEREEPFTIVRKDERKPAARFGTKAGVRYGYYYESLGHGMKDRHMEPFLVTLEKVDDPSLLQPSTHEGEEFIFVLEGEVEVELAGHRDILQAGDAIYYHSKLPHLVKAKDGEAKILAVIYIG